jgi:LacI family transcriptional regulator
MPNVATWPMRIAGFRAALAQDDTGCTGAIIDGDYQRDSGKSAAAQLLRQDDRPNAIIAANAQVALGVLEAAGELGLRVPEGLMVAAIDDPFPASPFSPFLAIVQQPGYDMGAAAVRLLARRSDPARRFSPYEKLVFPASVHL